MNDLNLTNMKLLHHFCLKHSKIGQICMRGGPFISSHPVLLTSDINKFSKTLSSTFVLGKSKAKVEPYASTKYRKNPGLSLKERISGFPHFFGTVNRSSLQNVC